MTQTKKELKEVLEEVGGVVLKTGADISACTAEQSWSGTTKVLLFLLWESESFEKAAPALNAFPLYKLMTKQYRMETDSRDMIFTAFFTPQRYAF